MITRAFILKVSGWPPVERLVRRSSLFHGLVTRFIAGDTLEEVIQAGENLMSKGIMSTLDNLGENTSSPEEAQAAKAVYLSILDRISKSKSKEGINISIKLTQCGLDLGVDYAETVLREVLSYAAERDIFVRIDMESSEYVDRTLDLLEKVFVDFKNVGTVLQTCLYRTPKDVDRLNALGMRVRLVKGAYLEPQTVAYKSKADVDRAYVECTEKLLSSGIYHAIATHDEKIIHSTKEFAKQKSIPKSQFEFQMLYGIRRDLQESLVKDGYKVRVYVPYGDRWYPYFMRRLAERPANVGFIAKALFHK